MLSNLSRIWVFVLYVTTFPEIEKAVHYKYTGDLYIDKRTDERITIHRIPKREKRYILNLLDFSTKPHHSVNESWQIKKSAFHYIFDIFKNTIDKNQDQSYNLTIRDIMTIDESDIIMTYSAVLYYSDMSDIWFDVSITPKIDYVIAAELHLYLNTSNKNLKISVYGLVHSKKKMKRLLLIDSLDVNVNFKGWIKLNVTKILRYWLNYPNHNNGLHISINYIEKKVEEVIPRIEELTDQTDKHPFLVGYFARFEILNELLSGRSRLKRSQPYSSSNYLDNPYMFKDSSKRRLHSGSCRLQKLYVRFRDFEFDNFIVAPEGYEAQFCTGECRFPLNAHMNATNHAIVQTLMHFLMPGRAPQACCAPRELAHLPVLYSRDGINHMIKKYRNMVIKSCGCL